MTSIPLSKDEMEAFTPPSLVNLVPAPVFRFRPPTLRDSRRYQHLLTLEGLRLWPQETVRQEIDRTLEANWSADTYTKEKRQIDKLWAHMDQDLPIEVDEQEKYAELLTRCMDISPMLRRMDADNRRFSEEAPIVALGMFLSGWSNVDTPFVLDAGQVPFDTLETLRRDIYRLEEQARADKVEGVNPGMAFLQLALHAFRLLNVDKETEKNSPAPSPSPETQSGSKANTRMDGASPPEAKPTSSRPTRTRQKSSRKVAAKS